MGEDIGTFRDREDSKSDGYFGNDNGDSMPSAQQPAEDDHVANPAKKSGKLSGLMKSFMGLFKSSSCSGSKPKKKEKTPKTYYDGGQITDVKRKVKKAVRPVGHRGINPAMDLTFPEGIVQALDRHDIKKGWLKRRLVKNLTATRFKLEDKVILVHEKTNGREMYKCGVVRGKKDFCSKVTWAPAFNRNNKETYQKDQLRRLWPCAIPRDGQPCSESSCIRCPKYGFLPTGKKLLKDKRVRDSVGNLGVIDKSTVFQRTDRGDGQFYNISWEAPHKGGAWVEEDNIHETYLETVDDADYDHFRKKLYERWREHGHNVAIPPPASQETYDSDQDGEDSLPYSDDDSNIEEESGSGDEEYSDDDSE